MIYGSPYYDLKCGYNEYRVFDIFYFAKISF